MIFGLLWWTGIVSFNSCAERRTAQQIEDVQSSLAKTEAHLSELTNVANVLRLDTESLSGRRGDLERQVATLVQARDAIAIDLREAARIVDPSSKSRLYALAEELTTGILGNLMSHALILATGWFLGVRYRRRERSTNQTGAA
jgi:hypothetical protein